MAVKKSELYSMLWEACNKLRGGVEPARYKDYVLVLLFHKYVSDRYKGDPLAVYNVTDETSLALAISSLCPTSPGLCMTRQPVAAAFSSVLRTKLRVMLSATRWSRFPVKKKITPRPALPT